MKDWLIERALVDELPEGEHVDRDDPEVARRLAELEASNQDILRELPPDQVAAEIERRRAAHQRRRVVEPRPARWWMWAAPVATAAVVVIAVVVVGRGGSTGPGGRIDDPGERIKGDPQLIIYRQTADGAEELRDGSRVRAGDVLQLSYVAAGHTHGVIVSVDGRGAVTLHHPDRAGHAAALTQGGAIALDHAYELDDAPDFERFLFVTARGEFDTSDVVAAARELAADPTSAATSPLRLPATLTYRSYILRKGAQP